jgi:type IV pilus assembly protein PilM
LAQGFCHQTARRGRLAGIHARSDHSQGVAAKTLVEKGIKAKNVNVCAPGFHVFSKFVKLPPVDAGKVTQIIQYEAQQNVPFPLSEVVWDYQILGSAPAANWKCCWSRSSPTSSRVCSAWRKQAKLRLQLCDASPAALCNAFQI